MTMRMRAQYSSSIFAATLQGLPFYLLALELAYEVLFLYIASRCAHQERIHRACLDRNFSPTRRAKQRHHGSRMRNQSNRLVLVMLEEINQKCRLPFNVFFNRFSAIGLPQLIVFHESIFEAKVWESSGDPRPGAALIACVYTETLAKLLFNDWHGLRDERRKRELSCLQASAQWAGVY
jgi:hypothetical protein